MRHVVALLLLLVGLALVPAGAQAQRHRLLPGGDWTYEYIARLQRRGHLLALHPTAPPYTHEEVVRALEDLDPAALTPTEARWVRLLRRALAPLATDEPVLAAALETRLAAVNNDRREVLRYTDAAEPTLTAGSVRLFPAAVASFLLEQGRLVADLDLHFDTYHRDDPDGLDAANRLIVRNEGYLGYDSRGFAAYLGRVDNHWSAPGAPALLLSDNPATFDRLFLRLGGGRVALRSVLGELDSITSDGRFTGGAGADSVAGSERRFVAAHRFDWRPSRYVALTFMEANLYSGPNASASLKYLNPLFLHAFLVDEPPKNDENNGLLAGMLWLHRGRLTLHGQLLLDDLDVQAQTGEPPSLALTGTLHTRLAPAVDAGARLSVLSARVYNTHQPEGRYLYLLRGLGTQFNDYVHATVFADLYADRLLTGLIVTPQVDYLAQGEHGIDLPYPHGDVPFVLYGTAERTTRLGASFFFQRDPRLWLRVDAGVNLVENAGHVAGVRTTKFTGMFSFGARLSVREALRLRLR